ncbi:MAG: MFS transporter [Anaerolineae bacterium]|nr:MFS transporter [Anaerolineae bacterium]
MSISKTFRRISGVYREYPSQFWVLILGVFIDRLGGAMVFPFFTLYVTRKFGVGMTEVGLLFAMFSLTGIVGSMFGGALSDRLGRKGMVIFGLVVSALTSLLMGVMPTFWLFIGVTVFVGVFANVGGPAQQAMVADLVPEDKRAEAFGILRVVANLSVTIGPMIGGLLASRSYLLLFVCDAIASLITAVIVYVALRETRPVCEEVAAEESMVQTFQGYFTVLKDTIYVLFLGASALMVLVYMQMNTTLAVYLRDAHGISEQGFGYILSLNAAMVVLFQFPITRWISKYRSLFVMTVGTLLYAIGFAMYGFVTTYALFLVAMVVITIGEMFTSPVGQAIVARLAPADMRGRYMAVFGFSWVIPSAIGPLLAGLVMDNGDPNWVWYGAGIIGIVATLAFVALDRRVEQSAWATVDQRLSVIQRLEEGELSAEEAAEHLKALEAKAALALDRMDKQHERRHLHIRISDLASGVLKAEKTLPVSLVYTALNVGSRVCVDLDALIDQQQLRELIDRSSTHAEVERVETTSNEQLEIQVK